MATGNFVSYLRISTDHQGAEGLGIASQRRAVREWLDGGAWNLIAEFKEVKSGADDDRPELARAIKACKKHRATLLIANLSRLSRDLHFITGLEKQRITFLALDCPNDDAFTLHIKASLYQEERRLISDRTRKALAELKAKGVKLGNPTNLKEAGQRGAKTNKAKADQFSQNIMAIIEDIKRAGITTLAGITKALNDRGVSTARNGQWHITSVRNVIKRCGG